MYYIENILVILLCCNITITIVYCPTYIYIYIYIYIYKRLTNQ
jgi:hypothetical protein